MGLNSAYYGPSIPPPPRPRKAFYSPGRGGGGGGCCCNPFACCCSCIMNCLCTCICQILCFIFVVVAIAAVICCLIFRPNAVKFYASDASLREFSLANGTLHYNLAVNLTIRNPNQRIGIYYDQIQARALYQGQQFATVQLPPFYQGKKTTSDLTAEFRGQNAVSLGDNEMSRYDDDRNDGSYGIDVKLYLKIRLKFWIIKSLKIKPKINCGLNIRLSSNGTASENHQSKRCNFDWS